MLPLAFDPKRLLRDLDRIPASLWIIHFDAADHAGVWSVLALYSPTGSSSFILPMQNDSAELIKIPFLGDCPYL